MEPVHKKARRQYPGYPCTYPGCSVISICQSHRDRHVSIVHSKQKGFPCDRCPAVFGYRRDLDRHIDVVHLKQRAFLCAHCSKIFGQKGHMNEHVRTVHLKEKPFRCEHAGCLHAFGAKATLDRHIKTVHVGEKTHACSCPECDRHFGEKRTLDTHIKVVHLGKRDHICSFPACDYRAGLKRTLDVHIKVAHLGERDHICNFPMRDYRTGARKDLDIHFRAMHSAEAQQRKEKEGERVRRYLREAGIHLKPEHHVDFSCWGDTFGRGDFLVVERGGVLIGECDEKQHEHYGILCEIARMIKIHTAFAVEGNTLPVGFIRYNPHAFRVDGQLRRVSTKDRLARLLDVVSNWQFGPEASLQIQYMYYDCHTVGDQMRLDIWDDSDYSQDVISCCRDPIV